jgi:hypothetical protein
MNTKPKWLERDKRVMEWEREPDGICVVTSYGFAFEPDEDHNCAEHIHIFENSKIARAELKWIRPCKCERCLTEGRV